MSEALPRVGLVLYFWALEPQSMMEAHALC